MARFSEVHAQGDRPGGSGTDNLGYDREQGATRGEMGEGETDQSKCGECKNDWDCSFRSLARSCGRRRTGVSWCRGTRSDGSSVVMRATRRSYKWQHKCARRRTLIGADWLTWIYSYLRVKGGATTC